MATTPNFSQPAIFSEVSTPTAHDSGYLKVYAKSGALCSIANGGSEKTYAASTDLSSYLPLAGGTLVGDLLFTDATYDIGKSGATRPRDGFFSRNLICGGDVTTGQLILSQPVSTTGSPTAFTLTGAAHTTLTASTEATDVNFNLARTVQFAAGAITTQRAFRVQAPTYGFASSSTITTASTLSISGPPVAGTNATITNTYALNIESGNINIGNGNIKLSTSSKCIFGQYAYLSSSASAETWSVGTEYPDCLTIKVNNGITSRTVVFRRGHTPGIMMNSDWHLQWAASSYSNASCDLALTRDVAGILAQRVGTNAQTFRIYNTYSSYTSNEFLQIRGVASNNFEIGPQNGSAGGTLRGLTLGGYSGGSSTITPWLTFTNAGAATFASTLSVTGATTFNSTVIAESAPVYIRTASLFFDSYGTHNGILHRRANGTLGTPSEVATNDLIAFWNAVGYHDGGGGAKAFHTAATAGIYMYASEGFTPTACGGNIRFFTTPTGSTTLTTRMVINHNGNVAIGGNNTVPAGLLHLISATEQLRVGFDASNYYSTTVSSAGAVTFDAVGASAGFTFSDRVTFSQLVAQSAAEITSTPSGTTQTITLNNGNHQTLTLTSSTGNVTATLTVPSNVSSGTLIVKQHASTPRAITWAVSSGTIRWMGTQPTWASDAANAVRIVSWRWDGSVMYLAATDVGA